MEERLSVMIRGMKLTPEEMTRAAQLTAEFPGMKMLVWNRRPLEIKHGMAFNHIMHSARWFWVRGMRKRAVIQFFVTLVTMHLVIIAGGVAARVVAAREQAREDEHVGLNS